MAGKRGEALLTPLKTSEEQTAISRNMYQYIPTMDSFAVRKMKTPVSKH